MAITPDLRFILAELYDEIEPSDWGSGVPSMGISLVVSSDPPHLHQAVEGKAAVCIGKVVNDGSDNLTVFQYVFDHPDLFLPVIHLKAVTEDA